MCPICLSTAALIVTGKTSAGGLAALAVKKLHAKSTPKIQQFRTEPLENQANKIKHPDVVSRAEWIAARTKLLAKEKELTRQRDALSQERRKLPMVKVEKGYVFESPAGSVNLRDLFAGHDQLIIYHFMFDPDWEEGCKSCSHFMDNSQGAIVHLAARNTAFVAVSRAPLAKIKPFKKRMGWTFPWVSSFGTDFNYDFHVTLDKGRGSVEYNYTNAGELAAARKLWYDNGELPGLSVFLRAGGEVYHTYSTYQRGLDLPLNTYNFLDLTALGRQEGEDGTQSWVRHHDRYPSESVLDIRVKGEKQ